MEPRRLLLGTLVLHGDKVAFREERATFDARASEPLELMVRYEYEEASEDKDEARIVLSASLEGAQLGRAEERITDRPLVRDDEQGYLAVPVQVAGRGALQGTFRVEARVTRTPWGGGDAEERLFVEESGFTLHVR
jgi:hypothetical protein